MWVPEPPNTNRHDYGHRAAAWVCRLLEPARVRAVSALAEHPKAAGRVAWVTTTAILAARGRGEAHVPLAMSAVVSPGLLAGLLPDEDTAMLRAIRLGISEAPGTAVLTKRLEYLEAVGSKLPVHFSR